MNSIFEAPHERFEAKSRDVRLQGPPGTLMMELTEQGLLGAINAMILHPLGYALGISRDRRDDPTRATAIQVYKTDDPNGVLFDADANEALKAKLREHGHIGLAAAVHEQYLVRMEEVTMDPKTQSEQMEDTRPNNRGFLAEDIPDDVQREQLASDDAEDAPAEG